MGIRFGPIFDIHSNTGQETPIYPETPRCQETQYCQEPPDTIMSNHELSILEPIADYKLLIANLLNDQKPSQSHFNSLKSLTPKNFILVTTIIL